MASKYPVSKSHAPGVDHRHGDPTPAAPDGVLSGALVSLYRAPAGTTYASSTPGRGSRGRDGWLQTGRTDVDGQVTFAGLEPALYVVKYEHHPETPRNAWR